MAQVALILWWVLAVISLDEVLPATIRAFGIHPYKKMTS